MVMDMDIGGHVLPAADIAEFMLEYWITASSIGYNE